MVGCRSFKELAASPCCQLSRLSRSAARAWSRLTAVGRVDPLQPAKCSDRQARHVIPNRDPSRMDGIASSFLVELVVAVDGLVPVPRAQRPPGGPVNGVGDEANGPVAKT